jgi:hypothetical protein
MHNKITYIASFYYEVSSPQASLLEYVHAAGPWHFFIIGTLREIFKVNKIKKYFLPQSTCS